MDMPAVGRDGRDNLPVLAPKSELSTRRERRIASRGGKESGGMGSLILVGGIAVVVIIAAAVGTILFITSGDDAPSGKGDGGKEECKLSLYGVSCLNEPVCYDGALVSDGTDLASATAVSCDGKHRWEAYAKGQLPADVDTPTYTEVASVDAVRKSCLDRSKDGPLQHILGVGASDWNSDVLPPTKKDFTKGDHSFYCVAERKDGKESTESVFK
jgi:hypothetical protein